MRIEIEQINRYKYFVTCPCCGIERQVYNRDVLDSLCKKCNEAQNLRISKERVKISKQRFNDFISDIDGEFKFLDKTSAEEYACCMSDIFTLIGKSGKRYNFTTYDDRLELEPED